MSRENHGTLNGFWVRQVRRLVEQERAGIEPGTLVNRGVALSMIVFKKQKVAPDAPQSVYRYLDDFDIAAKDLAAGSAVYRNAQLESVEDWLRNA